MSDENTATEEISSTGNPESPIAVIQGQAVTDLPKDLYIPPDALEVLLETFEGPLDLLLYFIKRERLDILDIPIARITKQYVEYIDLMQNLRLDLAADYLVMAAMLAEIKSRMLLPRPISDEGEEDDPRAELIRRLQEYERFKQAATNLDEMPRQGRDVFQSSAESPDLNLTKPLPDIELKELLLAFNDVMKRVSMIEHHQITREPLSVRERMSDVLSKLNPDAFIDFNELFSIEEGRPGVVVTFIAILELLKQSLIEIVQNAPFSPIHLKAVAA